MSDRDVILDLIKAWESTKSGETTRTEIQRWLSDIMAPAINRARDHLGVRPGLSR